MLHVGGEQYGKGINDHGYTPEELLHFKKMIGKNAIIVDLTKNLPENLRKGKEASVLLIKG